MNLNNGVDSKVKIYQYMKIIKPSDLEKMLKSQLGVIENAAAAIEQFLNFFEAYKIKGVLEHDEEDMLLFEYGAFDWYDGNGKAFSLGITRQFELPDDDEFMQLRLVLYYAPEEVGDIAPFNRWSTACKDLKEWKALIRETEGYKKAQNLVPKRYNIFFSKT